MYPEELQKEQFNPIYKIQIIFIVKLLFGSISAWVAHPSKGGSPCFAITG